MPLNGDTIRGLDGLFDEVGFGAARGNVIDISSLPNMRGDARRAGFAASAPVSSGLFLNMGLDR